MVTSQGEEAESVPSWYTHAVQWMLQSWTPQMELQRRKNQLEGLHRPPKQIRQIHESDVRLLARYNSKKDGRRRRRPERNVEKSREIETDDIVLQRYEGPRKRKRKREAPFQTQPQRKIPNSEPERRWKRRWKETRWKKEPPPKKKREG